MYIKHQLQFATKYDRPNTGHLRHLLIIGCKVRHKISPNQIYLGILNVLAY